MVEKIFVFGLPGSGKSSAARYLEMLARDEGWRPTRFNDYEVLYEMFQADTSGAHFSSTHHGGFDVHDLAVFDEALKKLVQRIEEWESSNQKEQEAWPQDKKPLAIVEFSRDDYCLALSFIPSQLLEHASFIFIHADVQACRQRILDRVANPQFPDDHYVSDYIFEAYYDKDSNASTCADADCVRHTYGFATDRVHVIDNSGSRQMQAYLLAIKNIVSPLLEETRIPEHAI